jgi:hypothetical protein
MNPSGPSQAVPQLHRQTPRATASEHAAEPCAQPSLVMNTAWQEMVPVLGAVVVGFLYRASISR